MNTTFKIFSLILLFSTLLFPDNKIDSLKIVINDLHGKNKVDALLQLADLYSSTSDDFVEYSNQALIIAEEQNYTAGIGIALMFLGLNQRVNKNFDEAHEYYNKAESYLIKSDKYNELSELYNRIGNLYQALNKVEEAFTSYRKAETLNLQKNNYRELGSTYSNMGYVYWRTGIYDSSLIYYSKALEYNELIDNKGAVASNLNSIGAVYYNWGRIDRALDNYYQSIDISKKLGNYINASLTASNIGLIQRDRGKPAEAMKIFYSALDYGKISESNTAIGYAYNNIAVIHKINEEYDSAFAYYKLSYDYYVKADYFGGIVLNLIHLGELHKDLKNYEESESYFNQALEISIPRNERLRISQAKMFIGEIRREQNRLNDAVKLFNESIELALIVGKIDFLMNSYRNLAEIYESQKQYAKALEYFRFFKEYADEITKEETNKQISEIEYKYELETNRRELEEKKYELKSQQLLSNLLFAALILTVIFAFLLFILNRNRKKVNYILLEKNKQIEEHKIELEHLNATKDKFFSIIAHDLKNPFITLLGLSNIYIESNDELSEEEKLDYVKKMESVSINTHALLDNLLFWSRSQTGHLQPIKVMINLNKIIENAMKFISESIQKKNITLNISIEDKLNTYFDKEMLDTIIRNLISNAVKFSYNGGIINIVGYHKNGSIEFYIEDFGTGIDKDILPKLFTIENSVSSPGTDDEKGTGLGLTLVKEFLTKNGGTISIESVLGKGSKFIITLPASKEEHLELPLQH